MDIAIHRRSRFAALTCLLAVPLFFGGIARAEGRKFRLVVSFESICCGTNRTAQEKLERCVSNFEKAHKLKLAVERRNWGKEGEFDLAYPLSELPPKVQKRFIADLRAALAGEKQVEIRENAVPNPGR